METPEVGAELENVDFWGSGLLFYRLTKIPISCCFLVCLDVSKEPHGPATTVKSQCCSSSSNCEPKLPLLPEIAHSVLDMVMSEVINNIELEIYFDKN